MSSNGKFCLSESIRFIDDDVLFKCVSNDIGFKMLFDYISTIFNAKIQKDANKAYILIEEEDEWNVIVMIAEMGLISIHSVSHISDLIYKYIIELPAIIRNEKINNIL